MQTPTVTPLLRQPDLQIFWKPNTQETTSKTYDEIKYEFVFDYDRENPVTEKKALEDWYKEIEGTSVRSLNQSRV